MNEEATLPHPVTNTVLDGNRPLPTDRDTLGRLVRDAWCRWAAHQPDPKPSWLVPWSELSEADREADRQIGETIARWTLIHDAAKCAFSQQQSVTDAEVEACIADLYDLAQLNESADRACALLRRLAGENGRMRAERDQAKASLDFLRLGIDEACREATSEPQGVGR